MKDSLLFSCQMCGVSFEAHTDAMVTIGISDYLVYEGDIELLGNDLLQWEGGHSLKGRPVAEKIEEDSLSVVGICTPPELGNNAICVCASCRPKLPKIQ